MELNVDAFQLGLRGGILAVLARRIGAHETARPNRRRVAGGRRSSSRALLDRIDVLVAVAIGVDHAADLEHLDFGGA